jgi:hypothetical protein
MRVLDRKARFERLVVYITERDGFVVSIPGAETVVFECLPGSPLPEKLRAAGYILMPADPPEGERILPAAITERFALNSRGELEPLTEGSTMAVAEVRRHAGICKVERYSFKI